MVLGITVFNNLIITECRLRLCLIQDFIETLMLRSWNTCWYNCLGRLARVTPMLRVCFFCAGDRESTGRLLALILCCVVGASLVLAGFIGGLTTVLTKKG